MIYFYDWGVKLVLVVKSDKVPEKYLKETVLKTLRMRVEDINKQLDDLKDRIKHFRDKYGMDDLEFQSKYDEGILGDDMDYMEWKASLEIYQELEDEKIALIEAIG
jgi:hypothetical protein